jgi:hypothetical protein
MKLQLVAYYANRNIPYEQINRVMTSEDVNDPDCECIFSSAVRLWWLTEKPGRRDRRCFKVSHNKISYSIQPSIPFPSQIVVATRHYFFTVIYRGIFSQSLWSRSIRCTASFYLEFIFLLRQDSRELKSEFLSLSKHLNDYQHRSMSRML